MDLFDMFSAYAIMHDLNINTVRTEYIRGNIRPFELFEAYLENEGIYGYTQSIVSAFRICWNLDNINNI